jgi:hypothetical protein
LEADAGISVPATLPWNYPTIALLAPQLAVRMGIALDPVDAAVVPNVDLAAVLDDIEALSDDEVRALLGASSEGGDR